MKIITTIKYAGVDGETTEDIRVNDVSKVTHATADTDYKTYTDWINISGESNGDLTVKIYLKAAGTSPTASQKQSDMWLGVTYA